MVLVLISLLTLLSAICADKNDPNYKHYDLLEVCPRTNVKKELSLGSKAAIFTLKDTVNNLRDYSVDFNCHLELEVPSTSYGFHVFFDEMDFLGEESHDRCLDYVQFARDDLFFTTHQSPHYCGHRKLINSTDEDSFHKSYQSKQQRFYIEEKDREMDVFIQLKGTQQPVERNLTMTVTVFKKACSKRDRYYTKCENTNYCIQNDMFCDNRANCAWPNGDFPTDETECYAKETTYISNANLPIIIIVSILIIGIIVIFFIAMRAFFKNNNKPQSGNNNSEMEVVPPLLRHPNGESGVGQVPSAPPSAPVTSAEISHEFPPAPPSYDDVIKRDTSSTTMPNTTAGDLPSSPPPYSVT